MDIQKVVKMYNEEGKTLEQIGKEVGASKTTLSRVLKKDGWNYNKAIKQYIQGEVEQVIQETINTDSNKTVNTENSKIINTVKCTFDLPGDLATALKVKSAIDGVKMVKIVEKALRSVIEKKYFDIK